MMGVRDELWQEPARTDCFLCRPNAALLGNLGAAGYVVAGLGPLSEGYAVVATYSHLRGLAEAGAEQRVAYAEYASDIARELAVVYGSCFVVEHGNMAVCGISEEGRAHCFHPHFLMIPGTSANAEPFLEYFGTSNPFDTLAEAIAYAADRGQYVLAGQATGPFHVFFPEGDLPRQFARALVAEQIGVEHLASWRDEPDLLRTVANAVALRKALVR
jgi:diadenosine tetraphosphate (Ap4A) HIT family hydrolase